MLVTHEFSEAALLGDEIGIIDHGTIVQRGTASALASRPTSAFVADFTGAVLRWCAFVRCHGEGVVMRGAALERASLSDAALAGAIFIDCKADDARWQRANVDGADFSYATLRRAFFDEASAVGVDASYRVDIDDRRFEFAVRDCRLGSPHGSPAVTVTAAAADLIGVRLGSTASQRKAALGRIKFDGDARAVGTFRKAFVLN